MTDSILHLKAHRLPSQILLGNPMGNLAERTFYVLEPVEPADRYLTCYILDGYFGNGTSSIAYPGPIGHSFAEELMQYQTQRLIPPTIFVFVDASTRIGGSQYLNSVSCGAFQDHIFDELIPYIESQYPVDQNYRIVAGHSSGGYGALRLPMARPGVFQASLVSAADSLFEYSLKGCFPATASQLQKSGSVDEFLEAFFAKERPERCSRDEFSTIMILAMASCYSPCLGETSIHARLPFDFRTLELDAEVWAQWQDHDPVNLPDEELRKLKDLDYLHLDVGRFDEFSAQFGHRRLCERLRKNKIAHLETEFAGTHSGTRFRYKSRFEKLGQHLSAFA